MTATESVPQTVPEPRMDRDPGTDLRAELVVARASAAARAGDLDAALRELNRCDDPAVTRHHDVTDLRARVHAQRGELAAAERCWQQLLDEHPQDESAAAGLDRLRRFRGRGPAAAVGRARHRFRPAVAVVLCAGAVTAATWALAPQPPSDAREPQSGSAAVARDERDVRQELTEQRERAAAAAEARRTKALDALAKAVRTPGTRVERHEDSVQVVFEQGLFSEAAELTRTGAAQLARVGERLAGQRNLRVGVLGHIAQVPGAPASGGSVTSLWRAMAAARALSDASGRPLAGFSVASAEQRDAPHGTDAANRTVTVILTPHTAS
ncbi:hypothetical protein [Streptomyces sp. TRM68367]|uniref:hypothetical protein n=1 Tax=Streptomyces sp. TRM68367 TaxID=2758415 RepID=UPI00165BAB99|nr:hypothetical protein [Streptomyces sp. TRM68367]MBC9727897.1 hypothetical protein [Streptomyces sp. TRM68367]